MFLGNGFRSKNSSWRKFRVILHQIHLLTKEPIRTALWMDFKYSKKWSSSLQNWTSLPRSVNPAFDEHSKNTIVSWMWIQQLQEQTEFIGIKCGQSKRRVLWGKVEVLCVGRWGSYPRQLATQFYRKYSALIVSITTRRDENGFGQLWEESRKSANASCWRGLVQLDCPVSWIAKQHGRDTWFEYANSGSGWRTVCVFARSSLNVLRYLKNVWTSGIGFGSKWERQWRLVKV